MKYLLIFFLIFILCNPMLSQNYQNIPKGYEPFFLVSSPDSSKRIHSFFWTYGNGATKSNLFLLCGFGKNPDIIWLDIETWEIKKVVHLNEDVDIFFGISLDFKTLVMEQSKVSWILLKPIFQRTKYIVIDLESGKSTVIKEKHWNKTFRKIGKLYPGTKYPFFSGNMLSLDKNILIAPYLYGEDRQEAPFLQPHELAIFKYIGHNSHLMGLCNYNNLYAVNGFYEESYKAKKEYLPPDTPPQFPKVEGRYDINALIGNVSLFDKKAENVSFDVKIGFTINCNSRIDSFFILSKHDNFFLQSLAHQVLDIIIREMPRSWWTAAKKNGQNVDCIQVLNVSVVNGKINKITHE